MNAREPDANDGDRNPPPPPEPTEDLPPDAPVPSLTDNVLALAAGLGSQAAADVGERMREDLDESEEGGAARPPDLPRGTLLGGGAEKEHKRYEVLHRCGSGGIGKVYRVIDRLFPDRPTAIKVVVASGPSAADLIDEAQLAARRNPKFNSFVWDWGIEPGYAWFAMEFLEGLTLDGLRGEGGRLSWDEARKVIRGVLEGLREAHDNGVVHGDLKPANVIQTAGGTWKILDWGCARILDPETGLALDRSLSGTFLYLAPECWEPSGRCSAQSDFYALGLMLLEMLTGRPPIPLPLDLDPLKIRASHRKGELVGVEDVPEEARRVILRATAKRREDRYPRVADFLADLDRPARRRKRRALVPLVVLAVLAGLAAGLAWLVSSPSTPEFDGDLDLFVVAEGKERLPTAAVIGGSQARLPLRAGKGIVVQGKLTKGPPSYSYLIRIASDGKAERMAPEGWTAKTLPAAEKERPDLRWPSDRWVTMEPSPDGDGLETFLWLVRRERLTAEANARIETLLANLRWRQRDDWKGKEIGLWWKDGQLVKQVSRSILTPVVEEPDDPISQTEKLALALRNEKLAQFSIAFCYSFAGR